MPTQVEYFGAMTPLKQVASITVPESTTLQITPFDPSAIKDIERAINVRAVTFGRMLSVWVLW